LHSIGARGLSDGDKEKRFAKWLDGATLQRYDRPPRANMTCYTYP